jgi:predicted RNA-binding Zn-ribbon protein involved in translation (DUF1610 family)
MAVDDESPPGSWVRELAARGTHGPRLLRTYYCHGCGWTGDEPSVTDASSTVERDGRLEIDRTHLLVCPACFAIIHTRKGEGATDGGR